MEARLENVWWESYKLRINLSRFNRGAKVVTQPKAHGGGLQKKDNLKENKGRIDNVFVENGKSFKNVLIKEGVNAKLKSPSATPADTLEEKQKSLVVCVQDDLLKKLQASFVGFLVDAKDVVKVNEGLVMEGYGWITATFMGGNMVLLSSKTSQSIKEAVEGNVTWWEGWFRSILEWSLDLFSDRRAVWLRCRGIPLHAWDEQLFRMIVDSFGSFIELDPSTVNRSKLDFARVKISSSKMEFIDKVINISVMEKEYQIWVVEEGDCEEVVSCRGRRCVGEWSSTASSSIRRNR
jgi:hypothetical protein